MIFPLPSIWFGNPTDDQVALRVDRYEDAKRHRMLIGIHVAENFAHIHGSLLIVAGHGKFLSPSSWSADCVAIPESLGDRLRALASQESTDLVELSAIKSDLALLQSQLIVRLKELAGKYVDRILAVSVTDPGLWQFDFDGQAIYRSLCDANKLADLNGLNVIDAFPARDVTGGGNARSLDAVPLWLMLADRDQREAKRSRAAILLGTTSEMYFLPGSDGLDAELPPIKTQPHFGEAIFSRLEALTFQRDSQLANEKHLELATLNGKTIPQVIDYWTDLSRNGEPNLSTGQWVDEFAKPEGKTDFPDLLRSAVVFGANQVLDWLSGLEQKLPVDQIAVFGESPFFKLLTNELSNRAIDWPDSLEINTSVSSNEMKATLAAMQGFLTIDQMPASLPWLTGCNTPQLLGQITPGRPASWRQLLIEMADYRPPVMKLKDAV